MLGQKQTHTFFSERKNVENLQVGGTCGANGGDGKWTRKFSSENLNKGKLGK
jgi:hypothetical protein